MANTPSYTVIEQSPLTGVLEGAMTAFAGINSEIQQASKARDTYNSFADVLEGEGLTGDAAIYRRMAANESPNFMQAAMTGKGATRDLSGPFKQAIDLLEGVRTREAQLERANISATGSGGVEHRQNVRMIDSILSNDYDLAKQEAMLASKGMNDAEQDAIRDSKNPELVKRHKARWDAEKTRYDDAVVRMQKSKNQRDRNASRLGFSVSVPGGVEVPDIPVEGQSSAAEATLLPDLNNTPSGALFPENPVDGTLDMSSRALTKSKEMALREFPDDPDIKAADNEKELENILKKKQLNAVYKTQEEARKAGDKAVPPGYEVLVVPRTDGKGFTYRLNPARVPAKKLSDTRWEQGNYEYFKGPGDVMYRKRKGENDEDGIMLMDKTGAGITYTRLSEMLTFQGENSGGVYQGPVAKPVGMSEDDQRKLPTVNRSTEHSSNPSPTPPVKSPGYKNDWDKYLKAKPTLKPQ